MGDAGGIVFQGKVAQEDENHTRELLVEWFKCDSDCDLHILFQWTFCFARNIFQASFQDKGSFHEKAASEERLRCYS